MPSRRVCSIDALRKLRESAEGSLGAILERDAAGIYVRLANCCVAHNS